MKYKKVGVIVLGLILIALSFPVIVNKGQDGQLSEQGIEQGINQTKDSNGQEGESGIYAVGVDLEAGEYHISNKSDTDNGLVTITERNSMIYQEEVATFSYITVEDGQILNLEQVDATSVHQAPSYNLEQNHNEYIQGKYKVGVDLPEGSYTVYPHDIDNSDDPTYLQVLSDSGLGLESVLSSKTVTEPTDINVKEGQYLHVVNGRFEQK